MTLFRLILLLPAVTAIATGDPSLEPVRDALDPDSYAERYRVRADLDGDGADDLLLSGTPAEFGSMGGPWQVYLHRNDTYKPVGEIWAHPRALAIEPDRGRLHADPGARWHARVWVYLKSSGSAGGLGYYRIGERSVEEAKGLEIYPGDGGSDLGRAVYEAVFRRSPIPFTLEHSVTAGDGTVRWAVSK